MTILQRIKSETPPFFRRVRKICIRIGGALATAGGAILGIPGQIEAMTGVPFTVPAVHNLGGYMLTAGLIITLMGGVGPSLSVHTEVQPEKPTNAPGGMPQNPGPA